MPEDTVDIILEYSQNSADMSISMLRVFVNVDAKLLVVFLHDVNVLILVTVFA